MQEYEHKAQYYETDQMGIIHHSNYIRWMEEARMNYLTQIGYPMENIEQAGIVSPVVNVNCQYKKSCYLNEVIVIRIAVKQYNGVKLVLTYEMLEKTSQSVRAIGESTHCFMDREGHIVDLRKKFSQLDDCLRRNLI